MADSDDTTDDTGFRSQYAERFNADRKANEQEQESLREQISVLQVRLAALEAEHTLLGRWQDTLASALDAPASAGASEPERLAPEPGPAEGTVPQPRAARKRTGTAKPARKKTAAKPRDTAKVAKGAATPEPAEAVKAERNPQTGKKEEPTLIHVVHASLAEHHEPRMASEVAAAVKDAYPERDPSAQVVRNALNALIARGAVEREKKQGNVFYTAVRTEETVPAPASETVSGSAAEQPVAAAV